MDRFFEFVANHFGLVSAFLFFLGGLIYVESKRGGATVNNNQAIRLMNSENAVVVDIREPKDFNKGHITNAINISFGTFKERVNELSDYKEKPVILVCAMGQHSGMIGKILREKGFQNIRRLQGGISGWQAEQLPLIK